MNINEQDVREVVDAIEASNLDDACIADLAIAVLEAASKRGRTAWEAIANKIEDSSESMEIGASLQNVVMKQLYPDDDGVSAPG